MVNVERDASTDSSSSSSTSSSSTITTTSSSAQCDESKCLSTGLMPENRNIFNCYGQGANTLFPFLCAESYVGVEVITNGVDVDIDIDVATKQNVKYYTCCPPSPSNSPQDETTPEVEPERHCTNPIEFEEDTDDYSSWTVASMCEMDYMDSSSSSSSTSALVSAYPYGRTMTSLPGIPKAYMCCNINVDKNGIGNDDPSISTSTPTLLPSSMNSTGMMFGSWEEFDDNYTMPDDDNYTMAGMPSGGYGSAYGSGYGSSYGGTRARSHEPPICYAFLFCGTCIVEIAFGNVGFMNCYNSIYQYPEIIMETKKEITYQCCSEEHSNTTQNGGFYMNSTACQATVWTQFVLAIIAAFISALLIVAISFSLYKKKNKKKKKPNRGRRLQGNDYSSYNLYLIFLSIPDLLYNTFILGIVTEKYYNGWIPETDALISVCATMNMYMNVVIAREVMILLQRTKRCQKYSPPTYKKATLQFVGVTIYSIILGLLWYYLLHYFTHRNDDDDENDQNDRDSSRETYAIPLRKYSIPAFYVLVVGIPLLYLLYICVVIWYQKLLPKVQQAGGGTVATGGTGLTMVSNNRSSTNRNSTTNRLSSLLELRKGISNRNNATTSATVTALATTSATTSKSNNTIDKSTTKTKNDNDNDNNAHHQDNDISKSTATATATAIGDNNAATTTTATATTPARSSTSSPAVVRYGRLNILVMYFARIILVFFCIWLPGMIMYYMAYVPDRNSSGLLHTVGLLFFSIQAIVSSGLAMSKPDIRQAIIDLYHDTIRTYILSVSASLKNRRQQQQQQQGPSPSPSQLNAVIDNDIDIIDNGNIDIDKDKVNDHDHVDDDDDGDDNGTRKETALLPITMLDGTSSSDDVEAPPMQEQSTIVNTIN